MVFANWRSFSTPRQLTVGEWFSMGPKGLTFPRLSLSNCERDRSDEPVRIFYSAEPSVGSKGAIGCSNILSFGKPLEGLKAGNRRSNNRTIYVRMRLIIYLFIYLFINHLSKGNQVNIPEPCHSSSVTSVRLKTLMVLLGRVVFSC